MIKIAAGAVVRILTFGCIAVTCSAKELVIIAHPSVSLTADQIQDVFVGDKQFAGSQKLLVVENASAQAEFLSKVIKIDSKRYNSLWVKKSFRDGLAIPAVKGSDSEVISFVKNNPGAIGYVTEAPLELKALAKFP